MHNIVHVLVMQYATTGRRAACMLGTIAMNHTLIRLSAVSVIMTAAIAAHAQLQSIGFLPGNTTTPIDSWSASLDGQTLSTFRNGVVYRWRNGAWAALPALPAGQFPSGGIISGDGNTFFASVNRNTYVLRGENALTWQGITSDPDSWESSVFSSTRDANVLYGGTRYRSSGYNYGGRWVWNGTQYVGGQASPSAAETIGSTAVHENPYPQMWISPDGDVTISSLSGGNNTGWVGHSGVSGAPFVAPSGITPGPGFTYSANQQGHSGDGRVLYARYTWENALSSPSDGEILFRWDPVNGTTLLPFTVPNYSQFVSSYDGNILSYNGYFIYDFDAGVSMTLPQYLTSRGADLTNWNVGTCLSISEDGNTFTGTGSYQYAPGQYRSDSWIVTVPSTGSLSIVLLGSTVTFVRRRTHR